MVYFCQTVMLTVSHYKIHNTSITVALAAIYDALKIQKHNKRETQSLFLSLVSNFNRISN